MLAMLGDIPFYLLVVVIFRDLVIIGGYFVLVMVTEERVEIQPIYWSKLNTFLQISLVVFVLLEQSGWMHFGAALDALVFGVVATSIVSGVLYVWIWGFKRELVHEKNR